MVLKYLFYNFLGKPLIVHVEGRKMLSTHFIYSCMASDILKHTIP